MPTCTSVSMVPTSVQEGSLQPTGFHDHSVGPRCEFSEPAADLRMACDLLDTQLDGGLWIVTVYVCMCVHMYECSRHGCLQY